MVRFGKAFLFALMIAMVPLGAAVTVSVSPTTASVKQKATQTFTSTVTGSTNTAVTWTVTAGGGSITTAGVYTAPTVAGTYTVTATSKADVTAKATATVTVPDVAISLSPTTATVAQAGTQQFTATVTGTTTTTVTWTASGGTVSTSGKFTAPSTAGTYTVNATSTANTAKTATATVTVPVKVVLSPATGSMSQLATKQYTATVTGSANTAVTWSCSAGSINSSGLYTAPAAAGAYTITATSVGTPQGSGTASITVNPVAISISPTTATVNQGATKTFTATVTGSTNTAVTWSVTGGGSVTSGGVYTPPASAATATVTATSVADPSKTAAAVVTVPDIVVTLNQTTATVAQGGTNQFTATVTGTATAGVNWSVIPSTGAGTVNTSGLYTAPLAAGTYTVRATSKATATRWAEAVVTVPAITVQVNPSTTTIVPAATQQYSATVTGAANTGVTWFVNPGEGTITTGGLYTAPLEPGAYTITAFSKAVPAKSGTATVTVLPVVTVQVSPATVTMEVFNTKVFLPQVTGDSNKAVTWSVVGGAANGWITPSGIYHAPARPGTFTVVATSVADPSKSGSATVVVQGNSGVWCSVSPDEVVVGPYGTYDFSASVSYGTGSEIVQYTCTAGTILDNGNGYFTFTAPGTPGDVAITAKVQGKVVQAGIIVHVQTPPSGVYVTLNPQRLVLGPNDSTYLDAKVYGAADATVNWSVVGGSSSGTITPVVGYTSVGNYSAPATPGTYSVVATSIADSSKMATMQVEVLPRMNVVLVSGTTYQGDVAQFAATVDGVVDQAVSWSASGGTITQAGTFTAPNAAATIWITVVSVADPRASACYPVFIPDVSVSLNYGQTIQGGTTASLLATVTGTAATAVAWSIESGGGSVVGAAPRTGSQQTATFYAPFPPGTTVVRATSVADPTKFATATYTMTTNTNLVLQKFTATPGKVNPGEAVELKGDFWNGTGVVQPGNLTLTQGVPLTLHPQGSTAYTLTVTSADGTKSYRSTAGVGVVGLGHTEVTAQPTTYSSSYPNPRLRLDRNGQVLMIGGADPATDAFAIDRYDPALNTWSRIGQLQAGIPDDLQAVVLANGQVLIMVGRYVGNSIGYQRYYVGPNFLFDPSTGTSSRLDGLGTTARLEQPCVVPLKDDWIFVAGGMGFPDMIEYCNMDCFVPKSRAFLINPLAQGVIEVGNLNQIQGRCSGGMLLDGRILIFGKNSLGHHAVEIYDPQTQLIALVGTSSTGTVLELMQAYFPVDQHLLSILGYGSKLPDEKLVVGPWNEIRTTLDPTTVFYRTVTEYVPPSVPSTVDSRGPFQSQTLPSGKALLLADGEARIFDSEVSLVVSPAAGIQNLGLPVQFTASGTAANAVTWSASGGVISTTGVFTATREGEYQIKATSGTGVVGIAQVRFVPAVSVKFTWPKTNYSGGVYTLAPPVWPESHPKAFHLGWSWSLKADALNHPNRGVTWSVLEGPSAGVVTAEGVFTATTLGTVHVVATSVADPSQSATLVLDVQPPIDLSITPATATVLVGGTLNFTALEPTGEILADWSLGQASLNGSSAFQTTAPLVPGSYTLQAVSHHDPTKFATAAVTVLPIQTITVLPSLITVGPGEGVGFRCIVQSPQGPLDITASSVWRAQEGATAGSFGTLQGQFFSGTTPGSYTITATYAGTTATATIIVRAVSDFKTTGFQPVIGGGCTATRLLDGRILLVGGSTAGSLRMKTAEIFDPVTKSFRALATQMVKARTGHAASLLPDGKVLITGGSGDTTAELFDPLGESFSPTAGPMLCNRSSHRSLLLPNGKVLIGTGLDGYSQKSMETYDPATGYFQAAGFLHADSSGYGAIGHQGALLLSDGRVLFAGATSIANGSYGQSLAEIYDIQAREIVWNGAMNQAHEYCSLVQAADEKVWAIGGSNPNLANLPSQQEQLDLTSKVFSLSNPLISQGKGPVELVDGSIWFWGTVSVPDGRQIKGMRFFPDSDQCTIARSQSAGAGSSLIAAILLPNGNVLSLADSSDTTIPDLYLADPVQAVVVLPRKLKLHSGCAWPFQASATGFGNPTFTWSIQEGATGGTISSQGVYTAPFVPGTYHVVASSGGLQAVAIVEVVGGVDVMVAPSFIQLLPSSSRGFLAHVIGATDGSVTWTASGGAITSTGMYTAPAIEGIYTLTATSVADVSKSAHATVVIKASGGGGGVPLPIIYAFAADTLIVSQGQPVNLFWEVVGATKLTLGSQDVTGLSGVALRPSSTTTYTLTAQNSTGTVSSQTLTIIVSTAPVSIDLSPHSGLLFVGQTLQFGFSLSAPTNRKVWYCSGGSISEGGLYTAPAVPGTYTVSVSSVDDPRQVATASVEVRAIDVTLRLIPSSASLNPGQGMTFTTSIVVNGSSDQGVNWSCSAGTLLGKGAAAYFAAPLVPGEYTITAISSANDAVVSTSTITVVAPILASPYLAVTPRSASLKAGHRLFLGSEFMVSDPSSGLDWTSSAGQITPEATGASAFFMAPNSAGSGSVSVTGRTHADLYSTISLIIEPADAAPFSISPSAATIGTGQSVLLEAIDATGQVIPTVSWSIQESGGGVVTVAGQYIAPTTAGIYHVRGSDPSNPAQIATAVITVVTGGGGGGPDPDPNPTSRGINVSPDRAQVPAGTYHSLSATVSGVDDQSVTWTVENAPQSAQVDETGVFWANRSGTYRVFATSQSDPSLNGSAIVTVVSSVTPIVNAPVGQTKRGYSVTALKDGRILIVGGMDEAGGLSGAGQIYDPATGAFTEVATPLVGIAYHTDALLEDGRVLLSGGFSPYLYPTAGASGPDYQWRESVVFNPVSNRFENLPIPTGTSYPTPQEGLMRGSHLNGTAVRLNDGKVLIVGSDYPVGVYNGHLITAYVGYRRSDLFDPATSTFDVSNWDINPPYYWSLGPNCFETLPGQTAVALMNGGALITGGLIPPVADMVDPCTGVTKTNYLGGAAGGFPYSACMKNDAILFQNGAVATISPMNLPRSFHTMTRLADGRVLIAGGYSSVSFDATPPLKDPNSGLFESNTRYSATATAEIYDPATGAFTLTGAMNNARALHAAILLPTGKVLIVGGTTPVNGGGFSYPNTIELFDPDTGTFSVMDHLDYGLEEPKVVLGGPGHDTLFISGIVQGSSSALSMSAIPQQGLANLAATSSSFPTTGWFAGLTFKPLEILQVYPELFSKVKTDSVGKRTQYLKDTEPRYAYRSTLGNLGSTPSSGGKFVSAISLPKGNRVALTTDIAPQADVYDYAPTNYHGRYYIVKVRRLPAAWQGVKMTVRASVGGQQKILSPAGDYTLDATPNPLPNPIVDVDVHPGQASANTFNNVGGATQPEFFEIDTHDETILVGGQPVKTGYQLSYYKVLVSFHGDQASPFAWDESSFEEPPGYFCDYSFKVSAWRLGKPSSSPFNPDTSDSQRPFDQPSLVQARQLALWPMPRQVWSSLRRRGTRVPMGGDFWVSLPTYRLLNVESALDSTNRKPWLQALLDTQTSTAGLINDVTYEHGGGHTGEHFSGNEIDMPPPGIAFKLANGSTNWDAIGRFMYNILNDPDVRHFIYQDTADARDAFFANLPATWQNQIRRLFGGGDGWKNKWLYHTSHTDHIHVSFNIPRIYDLGL